MIDGERLCRPLGGRLSGDQLPPPAAEVGDDDKTGEGHLDEEMERELFGDFDSNAEESPEPALMLCDREGRAEDPTDGKNTNAAARLGKPSSPRPDCPPNFERDAPREKSAGRG